MLIVDNLRRPPARGGGGAKGFILVSWCCLCKKIKETINCLLIHCEYTSDL
jgi:hypothetical protein